MSHHDSHGHATDLTNALRLSLVVLIQECETRVEKRTRALATALVVSMLLAGTRAHLYLLASRSICASQRPDGSLALADLRTDLTPACRSSLHLLVEGALVCWPRDRVFFNYSAYLLSLRGFDLYFLCKTSRYYT